jgi:hypothetical protein
VTGVLKFVESPSKLDHVAFRHLTADFGGQIIDLLHVAQMLLHAFGVGLIGETLVVRRIVVE